MHGQSTALPLRQGGKQQGLHSSTAPQFVGEQAETHLSEIKPECKVS